MNQSRGPNQAPKAQPSAARWIVTAVAAIALIILIFALLQTQSNEENLPEESLMSNNKEWSSPPKMTIDEQNEYTAVIETDLGNIVLRLFANESPITVNNFVFLTQEGYYDGVMFHRVIHDFMVQGGDPTGTGSGGPGYMFEDEVDNGLKFDKPGLLAMANAGPGTNGSQFFITQVPTPHLTGNHTIFGEVIEGMDTVFAIPERNPQRAQDSGVIMRKVTIKID